MYCTSSLDSQVPDTVPPVSDISVNEKSSSLSPVDFPTIRNLAPCLTGTIYKLIYMYILTVSRVKKQGKRKREKGQIGFLSEWKTNVTLDTNRIPIQPEISGTPALFRHFCIACFIIHILYSATTTKWLICRHPIDSSITIL